MINKYAAVGGMRIGRENAIYIIIITIIIIIATTSVV
jgi:hypothetical protein